MDKVIALLHKEITIDLRKKHVVSGVLLFVCIVVFVLFKAFNRMSGMEWNVMIWIVMLFAGMNAAAKNFSQESGDTKLYYYTLTSGSHYILAKWLYNFIYMGLIFGLIYAGFSFFLGHPVKEIGTYWIGATLGLIGISTILTLVAAVAGESEGGGSLLLSILALPLMLPILLLLIKIGAGCMRLIQDTDVDTDLLMLLGIDLVLGGLTLLLFEELWHD